MTDEPARDLRIVGASAAPRAGKRQQRFARLIKEVARLKDAMRAWSQARPELDRGVAECVRLATEHRAALGELVRVLDRGHAHRGLTERERQYLRALLCDMARELLEVEEAGGRGELKAIYNRHAQGDFDAEAVEDEAQKTRAMRSMLEELGFDFEGAEIRSIGDLEAATHAQMDDVVREAERREREAEARASRRKKSARQVAAEARREAEAVQVSKALQDVYRKLAIALHPDREPDPEERARKTLLMQQLNVAYEAKDLLQLLELQLRFEQIDEAQIGTLAEDRLERYNRLLAEQVGQLKEQLAGIEQPWRMQLELPPSGKLLPAKVRTFLEQEQRTLTQGITQTRRKVQELADARALKAWLRGEMAGAQRRAQDWLRSL